jgi:hypothetical protein
MSPVARAAKGSFHSLGCRLDFGQDDIRRSTPREEIFEGVHGVRSMRNADGVGGRSPRLKFSTFAATGTARVAQKISDDRLARSKQKRISVDYRRPRSLDDLQAHPALCDRL